MQNTAESTYFISGLCLPYECLLPFTLKQPISGSLRAPSRSANTHSLSLFIAEYGQPNALQHATKTSVKFTPIKSMKQKMPWCGYSTSHTLSFSLNGRPSAVTPRCSTDWLGFQRQKKTVGNDWSSFMGKLLPVLNEMCKSTSQNSQNEMEIINMQMSWF